LGEYLVRRWQSAAKQSITPQDPHLAQLARDTDDRNGLQSLFKGMARQVRRPTARTTLTHPFGTGNAFATVSVLLSVGRTGSQPFLLAPARMRWLLLFPNSRACS
jgi:hypothetical protein